MKLFRVYIGFGMAIVVAKDKLGVLCTMFDDPELKWVLRDINGNPISSKEVLKWIDEIPGYTVNGDKEDIVAWYRE